MTKIIAICIALTFSSLPINAAPKSELWPFWNESDETSSLIVTHQLWADFLNLYVSSDGKSNNLVDYSRVSDNSRSELKIYIAQLESRDPRTLNRNEQFAYWVNLYNAITVNLILDNFPLKSITKLGGFFSFGPWDERVVSVAGKSLTLNDIEHRILRPIWKDSRIHYAVNCASLGCPNLQQEPYSSLTLDAQLDKAAFDFINAKKGVMFTDNRLVLSQIYEWYSSDFGDLNGLKIHLSKYLADDVVSKLKTFDGKIEYRYDWLLNSKANE